jgi:predicted nucleic acid-binding protein
VISFDTNILFYASIEDCAEHGPSQEAVRAALLRPDECLIADQVYFELYRLLRNPAVLRIPFDAPKAADLVRWYRERSGFGRVAWEPGFFDELAATWTAGQFPAQRTFDTVLAVTLRRNGVTRLYTRNLRDFAGCGFEAVDPIGA